MKMIFRVSKIESDRFTDGVGLTLESRTETFQSAYIGITIPKGEKPPYNIDDYIEVTFEPYIGTPITETKEKE